LQEVFRGLKKCCYISFPFASFESDWVELKATENKLNNEKSHVIGSGGSRDAVCVQPKV
jgi:hypothetical protein